MAVSTLQSKAARQGILAVRIWYKALVTENGLRASAWTAAGEHFPYVVTQRCRPMEAHLPQSAPRPFCYLGARAERSFRLVPDTHGSVPMRSYVLP